jgi:valyl-tRNA synthetase
MNLEGDDPLTPEEFSKGLDESLLNLEDHWILSMLNKTVQEVNDKLTRYSFDQAATQAYDFFWKEFCSYYVEIAKPALFGKAGSPAERKNKQKLLAIILCQSVRLIHPMAPFISEELFQLLKQRLGNGKACSDADPYTKEAATALQSPACMLAPYPVVVRASDLNVEINTSFALVDKIIYTIRNVRGEMKVPPGTATDVHIIGKEGDPNLDIVTNNKTIISALVRSNAIEVHNKEPTIGFAATGIVESLKVMIPLPEEMLKNEMSRLTKEHNKLEYHLEKMRAQLASEDFVSKAPAALIEQHRNNLAQTEKELEEVAKKLRALEEK